MKGLYAWGYKYLRPLVLKLFNIHITGSENEPPEGGCLVCANHISNFDVIVLAASLKRQLRYLAKAELFRVPILRSIVKALGAFPIRRGEGDVGAIKTTLKLLEQGEMVGFYPQGTRHIGVDPRGTPIKHGIAMVATRANVPVLPVCIQTKNFKIVPFRRIDVRIGKPIYPEEFGLSARSPDEYKRISEYIFKKITDMIED
ncbi:MAG TPA: lysophospholipid acyltransferase family protein [Bacillota bacterium]|nr:1-acyl-sn-glycerol-3-phosphate acyltransferase [Clostridiales bacterium]HPT84677.1 lysophospholipid acyltransferase family protein [Bacillota bacterium]